MRESKRDGEINIGRIEMEEVEEGDRGVRECLTQL